MRPQRFTTQYLPAGGVLIVMAEDYVVLIRISDGHSKRFSYAALGLG